VGTKPNYDTDASVKGGRYRMQIKMERNRDGVGRGREANVHKKV